MIDKALEESLKIATDEVKRRRLSLGQNMSLRKAYSALPEAADRVSELSEVDPIELSLRRYVAQNPVRPAIANCFDYEMLLNSGLEYLVRAVSQRDDGQELSLRAASAIADEWTRDREIESIQRNLATMELEIESQERSVRSMDASLVLAESHMNKKGSRKVDFQVESEYRNLKLRRASTADGTGILRQRLLSATLEFEQMRLLRSVLKLRSLEAGNALNFRERIEIAKRALFQNAAEAYYRLEAAAKGIHSIFGDSVKAIPFPAIQGTEESEIGYIDRLLTWARATLFILDRLHAESQDYRVTLSLKRLSELKPPSAKINEGMQGIDNNFPFGGFFGKDSQGQGGGDAILSNLLHVTTLVPVVSYELKLGPEHFAEMRNLRLIGVAISILPSPGLVTKEEEFIAHNVEKCGTVALPKQILSGKDFTLPLMPFGDAGPYGENKASHLTAHLFRNINPCGTWLFTMPKFTHLNAKSNSPSDVWLELTVTGVRLESTSVAKQS